MPEEDTAIVVLLAAREKEGVNVTEAILAYLSEIS